MERLRQRADFIAAARGPRASAPAFTLQLRPRGDDAPARIGYTVTKKIGNAPVRNRIRRRLRAMLRGLKADTVPAGSDLVLIGRRSALSRDFTHLADDLTAALRRLRARGAATHQET